MTEFTGFAEFIGFTEFTHDDVYLLFRRNDANNDGKLNFISRISKLKLNSRDGKLKFSSGDRQN